MSETSTQLNPILVPWIAAEKIVPTPQQRNECDEFIRWCRFYDVPLPAHAGWVAEFILDRLTEGATLAELKRSARSISAVYTARRVFLDPAPIKAALAVAEAQTSPNRVLN
jgi:hypothetical protein